MRPRGGSALRHAPEKIVIELLVGRRLEGMDSQPIGFTPYKHVLDDAAFARRVHALQDHQHRPFVLRVKPLLQIGEMLGAIGEHLPGLVLVEAEAAGIRRIDGRELECLRPVDAERPDELAENSWTHSFQAYGIGRAPAPRGGYWHFGMRIGQPRNERRVQASIVPSVTTTALPPMVAETRRPPRSESPSSIRLGRPIS